MKNIVKKTCQFFAYVLILTLCISLFGCSGKSNTDGQVTLETVSCADIINFDNAHVEICISSDEMYYFSNRNEEFYLKFTTFLKNTKFALQQTEKTDKNSFYISINDGENLASFSIYENDIIEGNQYYYCDGIYNEFENTFGTFLKENEKYCRSAKTPVRLMNEYAVFDKNNNVMESDCIARTPYLFYNSGIVHMWVQTGTGALTRYAKFFDINNGLISPEYYGQTDYYGDKVCAIGSSQVIVYEMFSGEKVCCLDSFEKPLADCVENICSAYFTKDGTQIIVEYLNTELETEKQIFDFVSE